MSNQLTTLFLSNKEINSLRNFFNSKNIDPEKLFDFNGGTYCGRTYVDVIGEHDLIESHEDGIRVIGLGMFYVEDEE